jgi:hypothetical protein
MLANEVKNDTGGIALKIIIQCIIGGAVVGLLGGLSIVIVGFVAMPGPPGLMELLVQSVLVGACSAIGGVVGLVIGLVAAFFQRGGH